MLRKDLKFPAIFAFLALFLTYSLFAADSGAVTEGSQTFAGDKAFTGRVTTTDGVTAGTAKTVGGLASAATAAGTALTNSNTETVLGSVTLPANTVKAGTGVKIRYQVVATATNSTDTLQLKLRIGPTTLTGTAVVTTTAVDVTNNDIATADIEFVGRAAPGAAAACVAFSNYNNPGAAGTAAQVTGYMGSTNFATNGALLVEVTGTWSVANAGNSCRLDILDVLIY